MRRGPARPRTIDDDQVAAVSERTLRSTPDVPERRTHSYVRHGTTLLFAALDIAAGFVIGICYKRHRATEFLDFLKQIDANLPTDLGRVAHPGRAMVC